MKKMTAPGVVGVEVVCFWRPVDMKAPLRHMPLAVIDPNTVSMAEVVAVSDLNKADSGNPTHTLNVKYSPTHRWYFFPDMKSNEEVLVFK